MRHPYTKGNGAAVKTGIRRAQGEFVLILDADGQHAPSDARRLVQRLGEYDLVIGARAHRRRRLVGRRLGNQLLNRLASYLTGRLVPDLTSGFRGARREHLREFLHLLPNGFSTPTTTTLAFIKAGYNVAFEPVDARTRIGQSKIRFARDGARFFLILLKVITIFSPLRVFAPISVASLLLGVDLRRRELRDVRTDSERRRHPDSVRRHRVSGRIDLGADFVAPLRRSVAVVA